MRINVILHMFIYQFYLDNCLFFFVGLPPVGCLSLSMTFKHNYKRSAHRSSNFSLIRVATTAFVQFNGEKNCYCDDSDKKYDFYVNEGVSFFSFCLFLFLGLVIRTTTVYTLLFIVKML